MRGWLRLVVIGLSLVSIVSAVTSCKMIKTRYTKEKPTVGEAGQQEENWEVEVGEEESEGIVLRL